MALLPQVVLSSASQQLFGEQGETAAHPEISVHWRAKEILLVCINILAWLPELYFTLMQLNILILRQKMLFRGTVMLPSPSHFAQHAELFLLLGN